jgi:hypothetical protein
VVYSPWSRGYYAACQSCRCQGPSLATHSEAIAAWNRRAGHTAAAERIEALEAENARLRAAVDEADRARIMIGARLDSMTELQKECAINEAWHVLQRAIANADIGRAALETRDDPR